MPTRPATWLNARLRQQVAAQWQRLADHADALPMTTLDTLRDEARALRQTADGFLTRIEARQNALTAKDAALELPAGTDWHWRPAPMVRRVSPPGMAAPPPGARVAADTAVWHDCPAAAAGLRQVPGLGEGAPFGLQIDTLGFAGSYLSLSLDLPPEAAKGLTRAHIIRLTLALTLERPIDVYARLNIGHGPNTDDMLLHVGRMWQSPDPIRRAVEFDLHYVEMNERRLERLWLDLIFEAPLMNAATIHDLVLSRHPRAQL